jgi:RNA polymerase sigma-70 factor, ECF subfamily
MASPSSEATQLLLTGCAGDRAALDRLVPLVYDELKRIASSYLRRERAGHTLQTTALVNEAYLRLIDQKCVDWENKAQFLGLAAQQMRRILVDHARKHQAGKRGSGETRLTLDEALDVPQQQRGTDVLALDDALHELARFDPRQCRIVELRYFGGLELNETAVVLDISVSTVKREWDIAKRWLHKQLSPR